MINASAQPLSEPVGGIAAGMGYCSNTSKNIWGSFNNQAALASIQGLQIGAAMENRFLLEEMNRVSIGAAYALGRGCLFAGIDHLGGQLYSEMKIGTGYSLQMGSYADAGLQIEMLRMYIGDGFGAYYAFTFEGGLLIRLHEKLSMGIHCFNPVQVKWIGTQEKIPVDLSLGISCNPERTVTLCAEIMKNSMRKASIALGCEYRYRDKFSLRAGMKSYPYTLTFGAGIRLGKLSIDIASGLHAFLGFSPSISLTYF